MEEALCHEWGEYRVDKDIKMANIEELLGEHASLLTHRCATISKDALALPGPNFIDKVMSKIRSQSYGATQSRFNVQSWALG